MLDYLDGNLKLAFFLNWHLGELVYFKLSQESADNPCFIPIIEGYFVFLFFIFFDLIYVLSLPD